MKLNSETRLLLIMGLFVLFGGGAMFLLNRTPALTPPPPPTPAPVQWTPERYAQLLKVARHSRGDAKTARVTIVEFGDLECPSCRRAYNDYLTKLEKIVPIRLLFIHFPLQQHKDAIPAAIATEAADRQGKFWPMFDALYTGVDTKLSTAFIDDSAKKVGLDKARFEKDAADPALNQDVQNDQQLGTEYHIFQTPTFIIRDEKTGRIAQAVAEAGIDPIVSQMTGTPTLVSPSPNANK